VKTPELIGERDSRNCRSNRRHRVHAALRNTDCLGLIAQAIMRPMKPRALYWWHTIMLAAASLLLSAIVTGCLAYIADHILWE
jgi:hypothetical protein